VKPPPGASPAAHELLRYADCNRKLMRPIMENNKNDEPLDELRRILDEGEETGQDIANQGRERTEFGQRIVDQSKITRKAIDKIPPGHPLPGIEDVIGDWQIFVDSAKMNKDSYESPNPYLTTTTSGTASFSSSDFLENIEPTIPDDDITGFRVVFSEYQEFTSNKIKKNEAIELLELFGLDKPFHDRRSALEQFNIAYKSLERPVTGDIDPANTSLIPMRECIETALDHLLYIRPERSNIGDVPGRNKDWRKIIAISEQLKRDEINEDLIHSWARDWTNLKDQLSSAKIDPLNRTQWSQLIQKATLFIINLLSGLDENKIN
jgi:hypothetical protein